MRAGRPGRNMAALRMGSSAIAVSIGLACLGVVSAADVRILPVGPYGERLDHCALDSFGRLDGTAPTGVDLKGKFRGLQARGIPTGTFSVRIVCKGREGWREVLVSEPETLIVMGPRERMIMHSARPLEIHVKSDQRPEDIAIRLIGLHSRLDEQSAVKEARAKFHDLDGGRYLLVGLTVGRVPCVFKVDTTEFARTWEMDLNACVLSVDKHARVLE